MNASEWREAWIVAARLARELGALDGFMGVRACYVRTRARSVVSVVRLSDGARRTVLLRGEIHGA